MPARRPGLPPTARRWRGPPRRGAPASPVAGWLLVSLAILLVTGGFMALCGVLIALGDAQGPDRAGPLVGGVALGVVRLALGLACFMLGLRRVSPPRAT